MEINLNRKEKVLQLLEKAEDYLSGEELSQNFGVSRTTIWKYIKYFREAGYEIEASSKLGYRIISRPDKLIPEAIKIGLETEKLGGEIIYYDQVDSTNSVAKKEAKSGLKEGTIVITESQPGGRGRMGREFFCPRGGLWFSIILRPDIKPMLASRFTYLVAVAVAEVINELTTLEAQIKWPNDILINAKKVCGILTEMSAEVDRINYVVVGVGLNLNFSQQEFSKDLQTRATTVLSELGEKVDRVEFLQTLLLKIEKLYQGFADFELIINRWKRLNCSLNKEVTISNRGNKIVGQAVDIAQDGALVLEVEGKLRKIYSGDLNLTGGD